MKKWMSITLSILILFTLSACAGGGPELPPVEGDAITPVDYSNVNNWMEQAATPTLPVDVFFLYPTTFRPGEDDGVLADIDDPGMRETARSWLETWGAAFFGIGNHFAPYYRQLDANWLLSQPLEKQTPYIKGVPKADTLAAFDYYIQNLNDGRPFLLVSHSQGSSMNKEILFDYMKEHPDVAERMVASYVLGYSVTQQELDENPQVKFAEGPDDTGVIISYNTEAPGMEGNSTVWLEGSVAINPISWTRGEEVAPASDNLGSVILVGDQLVEMKGLADAQVDVERGVVLCSTVDIDEYSADESRWDIFPRGVYHGSDIPFYFHNLNENAKLRVKMFLDN